MSFTIRAGARLIILKAGAYDRVEQAGEGLRGAWDGKPGSARHLRLEDGRDVHVDAADLTEAS